MGPVKSTFAHDSVDTNVDVSKQVSPSQQSSSLPSPEQDIQQLSAASSSDVPQKRVDDELVVESIVAVVVFVDNDDGNGGSIVSFPVVAAASSVVAHWTTAAQSHIPPDPTAPLNNSPGGQLWNVEMVPSAQLTYSRQLG